MDLRNELQDAATDMINSIFEEIVASNTHLDQLLSEDQLHLVLAVSRMISEAMIIRYHEIMNP